MLDHSRRLRSPRTSVEEVARFILLAQGITAGSVTVVLTDARRIRTLNKRFHGRDAATDVLSFDLRPDRARRQRSFCAADVVISVDAAAHVSHRLKIPFLEELARYAAHGILHLAGYDDDTLARRRRMWRRQEVLLRRWLAGRTGARSFGRKR